MRKFIIKLLLALLPIILYTAIFVVYEPYNYWGLKPEKSGLWTAPLARVRAFMREPSDHIILGDSRMNHFDLEYVEELTGVSYANLSTGGQGHNLTRELYDWAKSKTDIKSVVMDMSFYQIRFGTASESAQPVFQIAESPSAYLTTRDYVVEAFSLFGKELAQWVPVVSAHENEMLAETEGKYREDLVDYAKSIYETCQDYTIGEKQMENFLYIIDDVQANGGEIKVVLPPVQESIWELVIEPLGLEPELEAYRKILREHTDVYDMEWKSEFAKDQTIYADGFHFLLKDGYQQFTEALFTGKADFLKILPKTQ